MCGIVGYVGDGGVVSRIVEGLSNLEYRGYDSAGVAIRTPSGLAVHKRSGRVSDLRDSLPADRLSGTTAVGHTRWSTHGAPTDENAHPHTGTADRVAVVHNGIVENHDALRARLRDEGHTFTSDTDTEVVPHLVERYRDRGHDAAAAFRRAVDDLEGSYAVAAVVDDEERIYAARDGSPLVLGVGDDATYLASDVPAFLDHTAEVVYLEDGDCAVVDRDGHAVTRVDGTPVERQVETVDWTTNEVEKGRFDHYMIKEIHAQPEAVDNAVRGRYATDAGTVDLGGVDGFDDVDRVHLVACGTSYHAGLYGERLLQRRGIPAQAIRASEYPQRRRTITPETLVVAVTQSGETADTLGAIEVARDRGARTVALTNVRGSSATRAADETVFIRAGPEIGVAATKTFSSQAVTLGLFARLLADALSAGDQIDRSAFADCLAALDALPSQVESVVAESRAREIAARYLDSEAFFFIGRGLGHPVALEGALKFKEITYEHAEGFAAGQLKHGPLALVTPRTPVFAVFAGTDDESVLTNATEAQTRGAPVVAVAPEDHRAVDVADAHLAVPSTHPRWTAVLANVQLQLLAYHSADRLGRPIDKPRNLAKSVTVE